MRRGHIYREGTKKENKETYKQFIKKHKNDDLVLMEIPGCGKIFLSVRLPVTW